MSRALARKKGVTKSRRGAHPRGKGSASQAKVKAPPRKKASKAASKGRSLARPKPSPKPEKKKGKKTARPPVAKEATPMTVGPRKRISPFAAPAPPPEKPPRLLSESKHTSAALALLEKGIRFIYQKEFKKARQEFEAIVSHHPAEAEIIARMRSYLQICDREEASQKRPVITHDQLYTLGVMEHNRGNYDAAVSYFQQSLDKHGGGDHVYYSLAASLALKRESQLAIENLRKAIELNEENRVYAKNDADFSSLHSEREFMQLVGSTPPGA